MLNNPYSSSAMVSASLPTLINTVSSSSYTFAQSSGAGLGAPQGGQFGSPYGQPYGQQTPFGMGTPPQAFPMSVPAPAPVPYPQQAMVMAPQQAMGPVYIQPARIITGYTQGMYRAYIPPIITRVPPYPMMMAPRPVPMPMMYAQRMF